MKETIIITGASGGIGKVLASKIFETGNSKLVLIAKTEEEAEELRTRFGDSHLYYFVDLSDEYEIMRVTEQIKKDIECVNALVHVAGVGVYKELGKITSSDWELSFGVNVTAPFILTREFLDILSRTDNSVVLSVGSGSGVIPIGGRSLYCATKFAMRGWSLSLSEEFRGKNPDFCLVTLGSVLTDFGPLTIEDKSKLQDDGKEYLTPEWVADRLFEIIKDKNRISEYVYYPMGYEDQFK